jgi:tRNA(Ile)-lysidine synthase
MMILEKVEQAVAKFKMLKKNDRVILAVSGGADSVSLLYLLNKLKKKWHLYLHLAHLNHLLRKKEAEEDAQFVGHLADRFGLAFSYQSADVADFACRHKLSQEEAARKLRYAFLLSVAKKNSAGKIALGHNRDDQAETVLMRLLRGSGASGLRGMPAKRRLNGCLIIRPLIEVKRSQILDYLAAKKISYRSDSTNFGNQYFRNRIRHKLIPYLEKDFNPNIKEILLNLAQNLTEDFDYLEAQGVDKFKIARLSKSGKGLAINLKRLSSFHKALQKLICRQAIKELKGDLRRIDYRHWKELEDLILKRPQDSIVDLPAGISVVKKREGLTFFNRNGK